MYSGVFQTQKWEKFHIKDGETGPVVWQVRHARFYRKQGDNGLPGATHYLIIAPNVFNPKETKYFVSNMVPGYSGITLGKLLWVGFSRVPIERCFEVGRRELGMGQFEVRSWLGIHRHFYISELSYLFCARLHQKVREKNDCWFLFDGRTGEGGGVYVGQGTGTFATRSKPAVSENRRTNCILSKTQPLCPDMSYEKEACRPSKPEDKHRKIEVMCPRLFIVICAVVLLSDPFCERSVEEVYQELN